MVITAHPSGYTIRTEDDYLIDIDTEDRIVRIYKSTNTKTSLLDIVENEELLDLVAKAFDIIYEDQYESNTSVQR